MSEALYAKLIKGVFNWKSTILDRGGPKFDHFQISPHGSVFGPVTSPIPLMTLNHLG